MDDDRQKSHQKPNLGEDHVFQILSIQSSQFSSAVSNAYTIIQATLAVGSLIVALGSSQIIDIIAPIFDLGNVEQPVILRISAIGSAIMLSFIAVLIFSSGVKSAYDVLKKEILAPAVIGSDDEIQQIRDGTASMDLPVSWVEENAELLEDVNDDLQKSIRNIAASVFVVLSAVMLLSYSTGAPEPLFAVIVFFASIPFLIPIGFLARVAETRFREDISSLKQSFQTANKERKERFDERYLPGDISLALSIVLGIFVEVLLIFGAVIHAT